MAPFGASRAGLMSVTRDDIPDSGLVHDYDVMEQSTSDTSVLVDQVGNLDLTGNASGVSSGINGNPSFEYDGLDDDHDTDNNGWVIGSGNEYTVAIVFEPLSFNEDQTFFSNSTRDPNDDRLYNYREGSSQDHLWVHAGEKAIGSGSLSAEPTITIGSYDGSTLQVDVNNSNIIDESADIEGESGDERNASIGNEFGRDRYANMYFGRLLHYNEYYDSSSRSEIYSGLASQWGF